MSEPDLATAAAAFRPEQKEYLQGFFAALASTACAPRILGQLILPATETSRETAALVFDPVY
jgi:hypothetical protein